MTAKEKAQSWVDQAIDQAFKQEIEHLMTGDLDQLEDAFYKDMEFGTGGMRGVMGVGSNRINKYTLGMATQGLCNYIRQSFPNKACKIAIAYDCRNNSDVYAKLVANIISANGIEAMLFSALRPTPELSFAVRHHGCQAGIVITASHNPPEYNGYKVYWEDGAQIVAPHDSGIIEKVRSIKMLSEINFSGNPDLITELDSSTDEAFITASLQQRRATSTHPLRIVFTSLHGTSITLMPELLRKAGYTDLHIVEAQAKPDGNFPTVKSPNPEEREALDMALTLADDIDADMVVGTDPDSDRLGVAVRDNEGKMQLLNGNQCGVLLTDYLLRTSNLTGSEFIAYTIVSSELFADVAQHYSTESQVCLTGFKHIAALIRENEGHKKFIGGGEESYGYMIGDFVRDKDALTSTLLFCDLAAEAKSKGTSAFSELCAIYERHGLYFEHLVSITKEGISGAQEIKDLMETLRNNPPLELAGERIVRVDDIRSGESKDLITNATSSLSLPSSNVLQFYTDQGSKISARPSGTEPKIKFYFSLKADWDGDRSYNEQQKTLLQKVNQMVKGLGV